MPNLCHIQYGIHNLYNSCCSNGLFNMEDKKFFNKLHLFTILNWHKKHKAPLILAIDTYKMFYEIVYFNLSA